MIVNDEMEQISGIKTAIEEIYPNKYEVLSAVSGKKCLEILKENKLPDLILLEIMMLDMSGWEVFDKIRDNPSWRNIPIIFLTDRKDRIAKNAGEFFGDDYIEKPIEIEELHKRIENLLNKTS